MPLALSHQQLWAQNVYIALVTDLSTCLHYFCSKLQKHCFFTHRERDTDRDRESIMYRNCSWGSISKCCLYTQNFSATSSKSTALLATDDHKCNLVPNLTQPSHKNWHPPKHGPTDLPTNLDAPNDDDSPSLPQPKIIQRLPSLVNHSQSEEGIS